MRDSLHAFVVMLSVAMAAGCGAASPAARSESRQTMQLAKADANQAAQPDEPAGAELERKIIHVAELSLVTPEFSDLESAIPALVKKHRGYLSDARIDRISGQRRTGHWVARLPVDEFDAFMNAAAELGVPESRRQNAEEVTEQYVDLQARIANAKGLEVRIVKLLEDRAGELKHVIEVERELARVRGEIEQMEGKLRYLANRAALATVTLLVREEHDYKPPQAPTYLSRLADGWDRSLRSLLTLGQDVTIGITVAVPWLLTLGILAAPVGAWVRRRGRRAR